MAGYSDTPLAMKLGIKEGIKVFLVKAPAALPLGFVDIKVCAVTEVWSGLKRG